MPIKLSVLAAVLQASEDTILAKAQQLGINRAILEKTGSMGRYTCQYFLAQLGMKQSNAQRLIFSTDLATGTSGSKTLPRNWKQRAEAAFRERPGNEAPPFFYEFNISESSEFPSSGTLVTSPQRSKLDKATRLNLQNRIAHLEQDIEGLEKLAKVVAKKGCYYNAGYFLKAAADCGALVHSAETSLGVDTPDEKGAANPFQSLPNWDFDQGATTYAEFSAFSGCERAVLLRLKHDDEAAGHVAQKVMDFVANLKSAAKEGHAGAAQALVDIATQSTKALNEMAMTTDAEHLRTVARKCEAWPIMYSDHPVLRDDSKAIRKNIQLSEGFTYRMDDLCHYDPNSTFVNIARQLYLYLSDLKNIAKAEPEFLEINELVRDASTLGDFSKGQFAKWWELALKVFKKRYPQPHKIPDMEKLITAKSQRKTNAMIDAHFRKNLRRAFHALALG